MYERDVYISKRDLFYVKGPYTYIGKKTRREENDEFHVQTMNSMRYTNRLSGLFAHELIICGAHIFKR